MTSPDTLLAAIIADPANDDLRLVYADLLDDRGEGERASFIRVQCEIARLSDCPEIEGHIVEYLPPVNPRLRMAASFVALVNRVDVVLNGPYIIRHQQRDDTWWESEPVNVWKVEEWDTSRVKVVFGEDATIARLCGRERAMLEQHGKSWAEQAFGDLFGPDGDICIDGFVQHVDQFVQDYTRVSWDWDRGFISSITCTYEDWARHANSITARCPIERVTLATMPAVMEMYRLAAKHGFGGSPGNRIDRWLEIIAAEWPRIVFTLPAEAPV